MKTKICSKCKIKKSINEFNKDRNKKDGLQYYCKECKNTYAIKYYKNNKERIKICEEKYRKGNKEKIRAYQEKYRKGNKEKIRAYIDSPAKFEQYSHRLLTYETRRDPLNPETLQVRCKLCKEWFSPTKRQINNRISAVNSKKFTYGTECHLYCSEKCKIACPVYNLNTSSFENKIHQIRKIGLLKEFKKFTDGSVEAAIKFLKENDINNNDYDPLHKEWADMVKNIHKHECEICGVKDILHSHHIKPKKTHPHLIYDVDNGACLCSYCHYKYGHKNSTECSTGSLSQKICRN